MPVRRRAQYRVPARVALVKPIAVGVGIGLVIAVLVSEMFRTGCPLVDMFLEQDTIHYF